MHGHELLQTVETESFVCDEWAVLVVLVMCISLNAAEIMWRDSRSHFAASSRAFAVVIFILCGCCIIINIDHLMRTTFTVLLFLLVLQGYVVYLGDADPALHSDSVKANHHNILSSAVGRCSIQVPDL